MDNNFAGVSCAFYTVKQLAALFGKSEDTIRRWKNEGVGREEDNIKLRAVEREDGTGRKNSRHLVFSREAVIEFVKANPFLMDDAPQLGMMMQAEGAWRGGAIPMPGAIGEAPEEAEEEEDLFAQRRRSIDEMRRRDFGEEARVGNHTPNHSLRHIPDFDWGGGEEDAEEEESFGFDHARRRQESRRREAAAEMRRKRKMLLYVTDVLVRFKGELEAEREELLAAMEGLESSGMEEKYINSIRKTMQQKRSALAEEIGMLEEFLELMEDE